MNYKIMGIGEVVWDMLPSGKQLGGAPGNFAYMASMLGDQGVVASRIGNDLLGKDTLDKMKAVGVSTEFLQVDSEHPTGTAVVEVDSAGQPKFTITAPAAWDFMEWTPAWRALAQQADVICFGTLAQRNIQSRETIKKFLSSARTSTLRVFDVNLRQNFFSAELLRDSLHSAQILKLNREELPVVTQLLGVPFATEYSAGKKLLEAYRLQLVCITQGGNGNLLVTPEGGHSHTSSPIKVADTVGAGDAFTACLVHRFLRGDPLYKISGSADLFASWVASQPGATPPTDEAVLKKVLAT